MSKHVSGTLLLSFPLDPAATKPFYQQIYDHLREAILNGSLPAGSRLPSTRLLARNLGVSRTTVLVAFEQLLYEGYIRGSTGSGTYVEDVLPDELLLSSLPTTQSQHSAQDIQPFAGLSQRGQVIASTTVAPNQDWDPQIVNRAFRPGIPALNEFPWKQWSQLVTRLQRTIPPELFSYSDPAGYLPLRREIAAYAHAARGVHCSAEQVIIVAGSQQAINLAAQLLLDPGDEVWIEDPCYLGSRSALLSNGAHLLPIPVDRDGIDVTYGIINHPSARMVYVTPSHQYPLGATMSLARRLALLRWAQRTGAWILEDDYDGEYRYTGHPLASLQGLDRSERVLYLGTFSKVLFPGLRLGYLIVPPVLVDAMSAAHATADRQSPIFAQCVLTDFFTGEHFSRHVRRMRSLYAERQAILVEAAERSLKGYLTLPAAESGMHLVGTLPAQVEDTEVLRIASKYNVVASPLSRYYLHQPAQQGLILGYTAFDEQQIRHGIQHLAQAFADLPR
ncbi:MAG TPA: PLP-dependent aminotransferase family protein [Dictyobacter sp.]|jgi:GntR family transcriptional regulator/MocR family aminotransferase|nr:PLP-dependent aminotransferase family protein [Dictyobacter sp.]